MSQTVMKPILWSLLLAAAAIAGPPPASAEPPGGETVLRIAPRTTCGEAAPGASCELALDVELLGHWHINADKPRDPLLIPTRLSVELPVGVEAGAPKFPTPVERRFEFSDEPLLVYEGKFTVHVPLAISAQAAPGRPLLRGKLRYQACDDERCLAPRDEPFSVALVVAASAAPAAVAPPSTPAPTDTPAAATAPDPARPTPTPTATPAASAQSSAPPADAAGGGWLSAEVVRRWFEGGSYFKSFAIIFLIGLALNLTPCIYPVIPLTVGYFAHESERRGGKTFSLALVYVLGMATMYSGLGVFAALSGKAFGAALANPWVLGFEAAVMVALALSMFGLWEIQVPSAISSRLSASPSGHLGAAFMGLTVGIVAAPCLAPAVLGLFVLVAQLQSVVLGFAVFFVLALGLGVPFLVLGTAAGAISRLPKSGEWMLWIKHVFGFVLLAMALYFLRPLVGTAPFLWGLVLLAVVGAVWLGWLNKVGKSVAGFRRLRYAVALLFLIGGGAALSAAVRGPDPGAEGIRWTPYREEHLSQAVEQGRPILLDFTAEWCLPCKELDHATFSEASVKKAAERFVALRADGTIANPVVNELLGRFDVQGFPTVLLIDSRGKERGDLRVVGFIGPEDFRARLEKID